MSPEDKQNLIERAAQLVQSSSVEGAMIAAHLLHTDRVVGVLDGILSALRSIEDKLDNLKKEQP